MNIAHVYKCNHCKVKISDPPEFHHSRMADRTRAATLLNNKHNSLYYKVLYWGNICYNMEYAGFNSHINQRIEYAR